MTDRSKLLSEVLRTWDRSDEGRGYLEWLLQMEPGKLDGGDLLREAVLDVVEDDSQLTHLRELNAKAALENFFAEVQLPADAKSSVRESTTTLSAAFSRRAESIREKAAILRRIRGLINRDRLETLGFVLELIHMENSERISALQDFEQNFSAAEELASRVAALSRTTVEPVDAELEWRKSAVDGTSFDDWLRSLHETGAGWFDYLSEELDRHYACELVTRLERIVERASTLDTVQITVKNDEVKKLFREAHEAYLYGFDIASVALCRSLIEHALRDRLSIPGNANVKLLGKPDDDSLT